MGKYFLFCNFWESFWEICSHSSCMVNLPTKYMVTFTKLLILTYNSVPLLIMKLFRFFYYEIIQIFLFYFLLISVVCILSRNSSISSSLSNLVSYNCSQYAFVILLTFLRSVILTPLSFLILLTYFFYLGQCSQGFVNFVEHLKNQTFH